MVKIGGKRRKRYRSDWLRLLKATVGVDNSNQIQLPIQMMISLNQVLMF